ncbi:MAG: putative restriction /modification enzyme [Candidatus Bipolaricaulis sibiricus]|uniref:Putative restriction /modification enzyme n=1 Tax=Bipolaricaulis sibiricus TaxID=2501609 RepID=A0A410FSC7_BIPS1|nr:MAG: putative restriction /modification enzyme [Candidatus Bipolaricaulis sibiricus]
MSQLGVWRIGEGGPERVQPAAIDFDAPLELWAKAQPESLVPASPSPSVGRGQDEGASLLLPFQSEGDRRTCAAASDFPGETFRVLKDKETRQFGHYRTRRLVLEAWERIAAAQEDG